MQVNQEIDKLFDLDDIYQQSEEDRINLLQKLRDTVKQIEFNILHQIIDYQWFFSLSQNLGECSTQEQQMLLNIVEIISYRGAFVSKEYNEFHKQFIYTGLRLKLKTQINNIIDSNKQQQQLQVNDIIIEQLFCTYFNLMKSYEIEIRILEFFSQIIQRNIDQILNITKFDNNNLQINNEQEQTGNETEKTIKRGILTIQSLYYGSKHENNKNIFVEQLKIHEAIAQLLHINCNTLLNCSQIIILPEKENIYILQQFVYLSLSQFSLYNKDIKNFLVSERNIFKHINSALVIHASLSDEVLLGNLSLLWSILYDYIPNKQDFILIRSLIPILLKLVQFKRILHTSIESIIQSSNIRLNTLLCLYWQWNHAVKEDLIYFTNNEYINSLIQEYGTGGGSQEENSDVIEQSLYNIGHIISLLRNRVLCPNRRPHQNLLTISVFEEIEELGGNEEKEVHIFHSKQIFGNVNDIYAIWIQKEIDNTFKHFTNEID